MKTTKMENGKPEIFSKPKLGLKRRVIRKYFSLKFKIKQIEFNWEKITLNFFIFLAFFSIIIGLIIFIIFLAKLSKDYSISGDILLLDKSGEVGDFVGGVVGAIWALTGVLLFYATLRLQSRELAENRKHFQMSRLTEIIYKQLDLFNSQLLNFKLKDIERDIEGELNEYKGRAAINQLRKRVENIKEINKESEQGKQKAMYQFLGESFAFIELNKIELQNIYEELDDQISVIRSILIKEDIPPDDLNELKSLFLRNIGRDFLNSSALLGQLMESYITYKDQKGEPLDILYSPEYSIKQRISVMKEFRNIQYNKQSIKEYLKSRQMYNDTTF